MNKTDRFALGQGYITNARYNVDPTTGYANINVTLNNQSVPGDIAVNVPHCFPYGMMSLPPDNSYCLTGNIASTSMSPIVLGGIPNNNDYWTLNGLSTGESALYNASYSLQAKLTGLLAQLNNANGQNTATMLYGENIVKVLLDILQQLMDLYNTQLGSIWTQLNSHTHFVANATGGGGGLTSDSMSSSGTTITPSTIDPSIPLDFSDLTAGKGYINDDGEPM